MGAPDERLVKTFLQSVREPIKGNALQAASSDKQMICEINMAIHLALKALMQKRKQLNIFTIIYMDDALQDDGVLLRFVVKPENRPAIRQFVEARYSIELFLKDLKEFFPKKSNLSIISESSDTAYTIRGKMADFLIAMERMVESRSPKSDELVGYLYRAEHMLERLLINVPAAKLN